MQSFRTHLVKLFTGFIASTLLILLPSSSAIATQQNTSTQIPNSAPLSKKAITWGGTGEDEGIATAVDGSGNIYVTGYFNGAVDFNPANDGIDTHTSNGKRDVFLSKFDSSRNFLWTKTWGGIGDERGGSIVVDSLGNVYVSGPFQNTVDFNPAGGASHASNFGSANNIFLSKFASDGTFQWVKTWGPSDGGAESYSIALDGSNNIYVVGDFSGSTCDFNPWGAHDWHANHPAGSGGVRFFDAYLSKFDSNGNFLWAKTWGGEGYDDGPGVVADSLGNVYVSGMYASQTINFDPAGGAGGLGHSAHDSGILVDVFLSKFTSDGTFLWVKTWGGAGVDDVGEIVTVDKLDNVYIGGRFGCTNCDFNPGGIASPQSSNGKLDAFVSKFNSSGTFQWAKTWGGAEDDAVGGLTTDRSNNVYVAGPFKSTTCDFDPWGSHDWHTNHAPTSGNVYLFDAFLSKFNSSGTFQWAQTWGGSGNDGSNKIASDTVDNVYVTGWFNGMVDFDPGSGVDNHTSNGAEDAFLSIFNDANPIRFAVIGDYGFAGPAELDVSNQVKSWNPNFIATLGDNNYDSGEATTIDANIGQYYHDFIYLYTGSYGAGAVTNKYFPVLGNHDWVATNAQPYLDYFSLPGNERYYDFIQGPVHFFMLDSDSNEPDGNTDTSVQATWLKNSLAASSSPWNIVLLHHAPFSSGQHGSNATLQWPFETWGADAVLAGHDHIYERIIKGSIPYFVNGLGGKTIYDFGTPVVGSQLRYNADYGAMLVDATSAYINFKFITRTGAVIDSFALGTVKYSLYLPMISR